MIGVGSFVVPNNIAADKKTGLSPKPVAFWSMGVNGAEVEVDTETGKIKVLKMVSVFDAGKVINPAMYEGQAEGAMVQAMGTALYEELKLKNGRVMNPSFVDYKIPAFEDMPEMIVEAALQEDVDAIGLSILSGAHMPLMARIMELMAENEMTDVPVFLGGIVPDEDVPRLKGMGVAAVFGPGTSLDDVIAQFREAIAARHSSE